MLNDLDAMIAWEQGELDEEETTALFRRLVESGLIWQLQGCYGREAERQGLIGSRELTKETNNVWNIPKIASACWRQ